MCPVLLTVEKKTEPKHKSEEKQTAAREERNEHTGFKPKLTFKDRHSTAVGRPPVKL